MSRHGRSASLPTIPIAPSAPTWAQPILVGCAAALLHAGCAASDEQPRTLTGYNAQAVSAQAVSASAADVAAVRAARWQVWDQLAGGLPDGYLLAVELLAPPKEPAFAVATLVKERRAVQCIIGVPSPAAMTAGDPASPAMIALGDPPPKQPTEPGIVGLGNALMTAAFQDNPQALGVADGPASTASIAIGYPPPKENPQPGIVAGDPSPQAPAPSGIAIGYPPPKETPHPGIAPGDPSPQAPAPSSIVIGYPPAKENPQPGIVAGDPTSRAPAPSVIVVGYPPPKEDPHPGVVAGDRSPEGRAPSGVAIGEPPPKEPPQPGVAAPAAPSQALVDRVRIARWQVWNQQAATLPDGYVLSVELLHSRPDQAFAVLTRVENQRAVEIVVGAPAALTGTENPASPDIIALGSPPPKEPVEPGVIAAGSSLLSTAFAGDAARPAAPSR